MSIFAGSAIAQGPNVGRIDRWSEWSPTNKEPLWLLLSGATDPPKDIRITKRRTRDAPGDRSGAFLAGVTHDLLSMEDVVGTKLFNTVKDLYLTKDEALRHITRLFEKCKLKEAHPMLYYSGHGEIGTGNWCFEDGTISIQEIFDMVPGGCYYPMIFSDACYSGHWANFCFRIGISGFHCLAACPQYSGAIDTEGKGGDLTLFMTGQKPRPSTEPMYSGGSLREFNFSGIHTYKYDDFISGHVKNTEKLLIYQSMHDGKFCGIFGTSKLYSPRPAQAWGIKKNYDDFVALVKKQWNLVNGETKYIYSLACDEEFGFGVFFMEGYGTAQSIVTKTATIENKWKDGLKITACAAHGSTFYIIMTKDAKEYKGKLQRWFTCTTWNEVKNRIHEGYTNDEAITGICYSTGLEQYFVVMTAIPGRQTYRWFDNTGEEKTNRGNWMDEKYKEGLHPTIVFKDPADDKVLVVMMEDENRSDYVCPFNYKLR